MFTWTAKKNRLNKKKHGFYLSEVVDVFKDPHLVEWYDRKHSAIDEDRYICLGRWQDIFILFVVFTEKDGSIHLITARKATPKERKTYEENFEKKISGN